MKIKAIENIRIIKSVLNGLKDFQTTLYNERSQTSHVIKDIDTKKNILVFEEMVVGLSKSCLPVVFNFWFQNEFYEIELTQTEDNAFQIPTSIKGIERRDNIRIRSKDISDTNLTLIAEGTEKKIFCEFIDFSAEYISFSYMDNKNNIDMKEKLRLTLFFNGVLVGKYHVEVFDKNKEGLCTRCLAKVKESMRKEEVIKRKGVRNLKEINNFAIQIYWPTKEDFNLLFHITNISGLGLRGFLDKDVPDLFPVGTIFEEKVSRSRLRLAWKKESSWGFDLVYSNPWEKISLIESIVQASNNFSASTRSNSQKCFSILTKAGLVKDTRLESFSNSAKENVFNFRASASKRWFYQFENKELSNLSLLRYSDDSWMIQELGSLQERNFDGNNYVKEKIDTFLSLNSEEMSPYSSIFSIYDKANKFSCKFWLEFIPRNYSNTVVHCSAYIETVESFKSRLTSKEKLPTSIYQIESVAKSNWGDYYKGSDNVEEKVILAMFGISSNEYSSPRLKEIFLREKKDFNREVYVVLNKEKKRLSALIVKLGLPALSNITSISENIYIIPMTRDLDWLRYPRDNDVFLGVEDICIIDIKENLNKEEIILGMRSFLISTLMIHKKNEN